jgi:glycosyltransferase involved in cell wall biosynthesis
MRLTVIVPLLDRAAAVEAALQALAPLRRRGHRVVVVDGGSRDGGPARAAAHCDRLLSVARGWGRQANAGARSPEGEGADALVFLPLELRLPADADRAIATALGGTSPWGFFDIRLVAAATAGDGAPALARRFASALANGGARVTGVGLADQAIFATRAAYEAMDGFSEGEAPPDIGFCRRARLLGAPARPAAAADLLARERHAAAILWRAVRRECWRAAWLLGLPWNARRARRWTEN